MIALIKPILFAFFKSDAVKKLLVDILEKLAKETDNDLDDTAVAAVKIALKVWHSGRCNSSPLYMALAQYAGYRLPTGRYDHKKYQKKFQDLEST